MDRRIRSELRVRDYCFVLGLLHGTGFHAYPHLLKHSEVETGDTEVFAAIRPPNLSAATPQPRLDKPR